MRMVKKAQCSEPYRKQPVVIKIRMEGRM
jgi:hypothetical protein